MVRMLICNVARTMETTNCQLAATAKKKTHKSNSRERKDGEEEIKKHGKWKLPMCPMVKK